MRGLGALKSRAWWNAAGTRAIKTAAQTAVAAMGVNTISDVDWRTALGTVLLAGVMSLLTSLSGIPEIDDGAPAQLGAQDEV
jgi:xanthine/uracil/vitamin C permease (AzgA family)